jgi:ribonuclease HI
MINTKEWSSDELDKLGKYINLKFSTKKISQILKRSEEDIKNKIDEQTSVFIMAPVPVPGTDLGSVGVDGHNTSTSNKSKDTTVLSIDTPDYNDEKNNDSDFEIYNEYEQLNNSSSNKEIKENYDKNLLIEYVIKMQIELDEIKKKLKFESHIDNHIFYPQVISIRKKNLIELGYENLVEWTKNKNHIYIGCNISRYVQGAVASKWKNPYREKKNVETYESLQKYEEYIKNNKNLYSCLDELDGKILGCWCKPKPCHGDILIKLLNEKKGGLLTEEKPTEKQKDKPTEKQKDKPTVKKKDKPTEKQKDKPSDRPIDKPIDRPTDKPTDESTDKPLDGCYVLHFDGCADPNPGNTSCGAVVYLNDQEIWSKGKYLKSVQTNNYAEYYGLLIGLKCCLNSNIKKLLVKGDSQLVINQMNGLYNVKSDNLKEIHTKCKEYAEKFDKIVFTWVPREENKRADELANQYMKKDV